VGWGGGEGGGGGGGYYIIICKKKGGVVVGESGKGWGVGVGCLYRCGCNIKF